MQRIATPRATRRTVLHRARPGAPALCGAVFALLVLGAQTVAGQVVRYVRYENGGSVSWGRLDGERIQQLSGPPWTGATPTGRSVAASEAKLLAPAEPSKVIAVGLNYKSHLGGATAPTSPPLFAKMPTSIVGPGDAIVLPADAENVHYEAELVLVIGKRAKHVSEADALQYVFGVTAGNDVSARAWQRSDLQWFRAKASDTFGPLGPVLATGLDPANLLVVGKHNGKTVQSERSSDLLFGPAAIVSFVSRYVTLLPGDVIFTGTPGSTAALAAGDVFEVEVEGVGTLRNPVVAEDAREP